MHRWGAVEGRLASRRRRRRAPGHPTHQLISTQVHASVGSQSEQYFVVEKRYNYVTPTSFLELISFYKSLLAERRQEMSNQIERLATGLQTLKNTNKDVTALKEDLKIKMVDVNKKKAECDVFLEKMALTQREK